MTRCESDRTAKIYCCGFCPRGNRCTQACFRRELDVGLGGSECGGFLVEHGDGETLRVCIERRIGACVRHHGITDGEHIPWIVADLKGHRLTVIDDGRMSPGNRGIAVPW